MKIPPVAKALFGVALLLLLYALGTGPESSARSKTQVALGLCGGLLMFVGLLELMIDRPIQEIGDRWSKLLPWKQWLVAAITVPAFAVGVTSIIAIAH